MKQEKRTAGFTLVELIVVIAVMGILAGVGTVGYAGYVKSTKKNADKILVGNIVRAIEMGTNSTMFVPPDPLSISTTTYPVGFVVLNPENDAKVVVSNASLRETGGECVFSEPVEITYVVAKDKTINCPEGDKSETQTVYEKKTVTLSYCTTHSRNQPSYPASEITYATDYTYQHNKGLFITTHNLTTKSTLTIGTNELFTTNIDNLYEVSGKGKCEFAANPGLNSSGPVEADDSNALYRAITAAYGSLEGLRLNYDGWVSEEGVSYATFYTYAPEVFNKVKDQTQLLITAVNNPIISGAAAAVGINLSSYLTEGSYADSADLLNSFSEFVSSRMTEEQWNSAWAGAAGYGNDEYDFGLLSRGAKNDYMWAARMAYNASFASYCDANGIASTYTELITNYGENELSGALRIPSVVNNYAFGRTGEASLKQDFINADAANGENAFEQCKKLYEQYLSSICTENGKVFYNTVGTLAETGDVAMDTNNAFGGDYFAYYDSYLQEMATLYQGAQDAAADGIIIVVSVENGDVTCNVSPAVADPRTSD